MGERSAPRRGPEDYCRIGPVYVRRQLVLLLLIAGSIAVLLLFGLPFSLPDHGARQIPACRYDDPALAGISGLVQVLDAAGRVRYEGEVSAGTYTGRGQVFGADGELVYDGPLADGVYEGPDAKVYRSGVLVYAGEMAGNLYQGQGRRFDPDTGIVSQGQFSKGFMEGWGQEFHPGGALLREGVFSRDLLEGEGAEYGRDQTLLREGTFSAGRLHGEGREYAVGGKLQYEGQFWRGVYHGHGVLYNAPLGVPSVSGTFVYGKLSGLGTIYHPSGQALYTGQVCGERPRADAFLGLPLSEVESAFSIHWQLYSCGEITAFAYPYFNLMFVTESPVPLAPAQEESRREDPEPSESPEDDQAGLPEPSGERLSPDADKGDIIITQVLSYGQPLSCAAQPQDGSPSGRHLPGWREWFSGFAENGTAQGAFVRQSGPFVWRFTPRPPAGEEAYVGELLSEYADVEIMTVRREDKDMSFWYQTAKWRDGP